MFELSLLSEPSQKVVATSFSFSFAFFYADSLRLAYLTLSYEPSLSQTWMFYDLILIQIRRGATTIRIRGPVEMVNRKLVWV
jgi:hypothetical protein